MGWLRGFVLVVVGVLGVGGFANGLPTPADLDARWLRNYQARGPAPGADTQGLATLVLEGTLVHWNPDHLVQALAWLEGARQTDPRQRGYLNLHWYWGDAQVADQNAVEFVTRLVVLGPLVVPEGDPRVRTATLAFLRANLEGIRRHKVALSYTNIALMKAWNLVALGQVLGDAQARREGADWLAQWLDEVDRNGIHEFLSPTYSAVDLVNLGLLVRYADDPVVRDGAKRGLDTLWNTLGVHWFAPSQRLGGTHSRDYDRLGGHGEVDRWVLRALGADGGAASWGSTLNDLAWVPPSQPLAPLAPGATAVLKWDAASTATWYRGRAFGIGSATDNYHNMDKTPFVADLGPGPRGDAPVVAFWMDARRDYYGLSRILEGSGHWKSLHLRPFEAAAQSRNQVLFLAAGDSEGQDRLESTFSLPADGEYWLNGTKVDLFRHRSLWAEVPAPGDRTALTVEATPRGPVLVIDDRDPSQGVGVQQTLPVVEGHRYRTTVTGEGGLSLYHNYVDAAGRLVGGERSRLVKGSGTSTFESTAPAGAVAVRAWLYSSSSAVGTFRLSGVSFEEVGGPTLAGFDWEPFVPGEVNVPVGADLAVRLGAATLVLRVVAATGTDGPAPLVLSNDGVTHGAFRLTATHSSVPTRDRRLVVVYAAAGDTPDEASFRAFVAQVAGVKTTVDLQGPRVRASAAGDQPLSLDVDLVARTKTVAPLPASGTSDILSP